MKAARNYPYALHRKDPLKSPPLKTSFKAYAIQPIYEEFSFNLS